jgi:hypothetical protein
MKFKILLLRSKNLKNLPTIRVNNIKIRLEDDSLYGKKTKLKLNGKNAQTLPSDLCSLSVLMHLDLSADRLNTLKRFNLAKIPKDIALLQNLRELHIDGNNLASLPAEMGSLIQLEILTMSNNRLSVLPFAFKNLKKLRSLHIDHNCFAAFPSVVCLIDTLRYLDLSSNELTQIDARISNLKSLEVLLIVSNHLLKLPDSLCDCSDLQTLWIGENFIKELPRYLYRLRKLDWHSTPFLSSLIDGNPMEVPPMNICKKGLRFIEKYLKENLEN